MVATGTSRGVGPAAAPGTSRRIVVVAGGEPEHDWRRSPRSGECCTACWWQRAFGGRPGWEKGDNTTHLGCLILSIRTFGGRRQLPRVKIDAGRFALTHGRGGVRARGGAGPTGRGSRGFSLTN